MKKENKREKQLIKNTFILAIGNISTKCMTFLLVPIYTNYLSPADYGLIDLLNVVVLLLVPIVSVQIPNGMFRFLIDRNKNDEKEKIVTNVILLTTIISAFFLLCALAIKCIFDLQYLELLVLCVITNIFSVIELQYARGEGNFVTYTVSSVIISVVTIGSNIIMIVFLNYGGKSILVSAIIAYICGTVYIVLATHNYKYIKIRAIDYKISKEMLKYSVPLIPNELSWWITNASDRLIVVSFLGASSNGILGIAYKLPSIYTTLFNIFNITWAESICRAIRDIDAKHYINKMFSRAFVILLELETIIVTIIPLIFNWYIGSNYKDSYYLVLILCVAMFINSLGSLYGGIFLAKKQSREIAQSTIIGAVLNIFFHLILIKYIGLYAAVISTLISYIVICFIRYMQCKNLIVLKWNRQLLARTLLFSIAIVLYCLKIKMLCIILLFIEIIVFSNEIKKLYCLMINEKKVK